jgi:hypothetical protein
MTDPTGTDGHLAVAGCARKRRCHLGAVGVANEFADVRSSLAYTFLSAICIAASAISRLCSVSIRLKRFVSHSALSSQHQLRQGIVMRHVRNPARRIAILFLPLALGACAQYGVMNTSASTGPRTFAWDGAGEDPNLPQRTPRHSANVSQAIEPSADEREQISDADADRKLASKLVICKGCIKPPETAERTDGSRVASR